MAVAFIVCFIVSQQLYILLLHPFQMADGAVAEQKAAGHKSNPLDLLLGGR